MGFPVIYKVTRLIVLLLGLLPALAAAEPVTLKFAYFSRIVGISSFRRRAVCQCGQSGRARPRQNETYSGSPWRPVGTVAARPRRTTDIGYVVPPYEQATFPNASVIELPASTGCRRGDSGLHRISAFGPDTRLQGLLRIGAFASEPETIHSRSPLTSLAELRGERVRVNNDFEAQLLAKLGAKPQFIPLNRAADAISAGRIDAGRGAAGTDDRIRHRSGRVPSLSAPTSCVPQALLMNRKRFESLPGDVQAIIREHSGNWFVDNYNRINEAATARVLNQLKSDSRRTVAVPSAADMNTVDTAAEAIVAANAARAATTPSLSRPPVRCWRVCGQQDEVCRVAGRKDGVSCTRFSKTVAECLDAGRADDRGHLCSCAASGEEVTLKLSFVTSDRSSIYQCYIKPFVDAVNVDGAELCGSMSTSAVRSIRTCPNKRGWSSKAPLT